MPDPDSFLESAMVFLLQDPSQDLPAALINLLNMKQRQIYEETRDLRLATRLTWGVFRGLIGLKKDSKTPTGWCIDSKDPEVIVVVPGTIVSKDNFYTPYIPSLPVCIENVFKKGKNPYKEVWAGLGTNQRKLENYARAMMLRITPDIRKEAFKRILPIAGPSSARSFSNQKSISDIQRLLSLNDTDLKLYLITDNDLFQRFDPAGLAEHMSYRQLLAVIRNYRENNGYQILCETYKDYYKEKGKFPTLSALRCITRIVPPAYLSRMGKAVVREIVFNAGDLYAKKTQDLEKTIYYYMHSIKSTFMLRPLQADIKLTEEQIASLLLPEGFSVQGPASSRPANYVHVPVVRKGYRRPWRIIYQRFGPLITRYALISEFSPNPRVLGTHVLSGAKQKVCGEHWVIPEEYVLSCSYSGKPVSLEMLQDSNHVLRNLLEIVSNSNYSQYITAQHE
ncbi:MAG: hypothetical protein D6698_02515 [Gammaproteobacteria bacterium]|nr:MAG: hypothetical protein D6698_02515 [Gammaproteobacteria bacterium]